VARSLQLRLATEAGTYRGDRAVGAAPWMAAQGAGVHAARQTFPTYSFELLTPRCRSTYESSPHIGTVRFLELDCSHLLAPPFADLWGGRGRFPDINHLSFASADYTPAYRGQIALKQRAGTNFVTLYILCLPLPAIDCSEYRCSIPLVLNEVQGVG